MAMTMYEVGQYFKSETAAMAIGATGGILGSTFVGEYLATALDLSEWKAVAVKILAGILVSLGLFIVSRKTVGAANWVLKAASVGAIAAPLVSVIEVSIPGAEV